MTDTENEIKEGEETTPEVDVPAEEAPEADEVDA